MGIKPSSSKSSKESYPPTFYLNTADPLKAAAIIVNPGDEIPSVDFLLKPTHVPAFVLRFFYVRMAPTEPADPTF